MFLFDSNEPEKPKMMYWKRKEQILIWSKGNREAQFRDVLLGWVGWVGSVEGLHSGDLTTLLLGCASKSKLNLFFLIDQVPSVVFLFLFFFSRREQREQTLRF